MNRQRPIQVLLWVMLSISTMGSIGFFTNTNHPKPLQQTSLKETSVLQDEEASGFAAAFARQWLTWKVGESQKAWQARMQPFVASTLLGSAQPVPIGHSQKSQQVGAVFPIQVKRVGQSSFLVDVYAQTNLHPLIRLTVPIDFDHRGRPAVIQWPLLHPVPSAGSPGTTSPGQAASDSVTATLQPVVTSFLQAYLAGKSPDDLTNFVAPGTTLQPLHGLLQWKDLHDMRVFGTGPYTVIVTADVVDPADQVTLPQTYVLKMIQNGGKWFVSALKP
ncbi:conjugal transfer protein [Ferroacidibacillus organovorans]|uniref:Conjugative transposon protein TcpC n=1 Tax=Ferroacidibacillus organovorans TaxID=1765683 RepID=A0A101XQQ8_9BACL|nr:conjugal transfer protein [Ferroacidibacillus organovorans]KUO95807.1 hypothetical protein ATW55_15035 [Ferroacidibacillus organovorans]